MNNIVFRTCLTCFFHGKEDEDFKYEGDGVWRCTICGYKWTEVYKIINPDKKEN